MNDLLAGGLANGGAIAVLTQGFIVDSIEPFRRFKKPRAKVTVVRCEHG